MRLPVFALMSLCALCACSSEAPPPPPPPAEAPKTILDDQLKAVDKAKAVEQQLIDEKAKMDKALEESGG